MQLSPERLSRQLAAGLAPVYTVQGGESLQTRECVDAIRAAARQHGFGEHLTFEPTAVIAKGDEETLIYAEMRRDAVAQILRRLRIALRGEKPADAAQP